MRFNYSFNLYQLMLAALFNNETQDTYSKYYKILKNEYEFNPKLVCCEFGLGNIGAFKIVFKDEDAKIITCCFHLSQCILKKANSLYLRKKNLLKKQN